MSLSSSRMSLNGSGDSKLESCRRHSLNPCMLADEPTSLRKKTRTTSIDGCFYKEVNQKNEGEEKLTIELVNDKSRYSGLCSPVTRIRNWLSNLFGSNGNNSKTTERKLDALELLQDGTNTDNGREQDDKMSVSSVGTVVNAVYTKRK